MTRFYFDFTLTLEDGVYYSEGFLKAYALYQAKQVYGMHLKLKNLEIAKETFQGNKLIVEINLVK